MLDKCPNNYLETILLNNSKFIDVIKKEILPHFSSSLIDDYTTKGVKIAALAEILNEKTFLTVKHDSKTNFLVICLNENIKKEIFVNFFEAQNSNILCFEVDFLKKELEPKSFLFKNENISILYDLENIKISSPFFDDALIYSFKLDNNKWINIEESSFLSSTKLNHFIKENSSNKKMLTILNEISAFNNIVIKKPSVALDFLLNNNKVSEEYLSLLSLEHDIDFNASILKKNNMVVDSKKILFREFLNIKMAKKTNKI